MKKSYFLISLAIAFIGITVWIVRESRHADQFVTRLEPRPLFQISGGAIRYKEPRGLSLSPSGNLLVTDFRNYRIQEVSPSGQVLREWGSYGNAPGQLNDPTCAAMDAQGNLYVVDTWNHRIQKHTPDGQWIADWAKFAGFFAPRGIAIDHNNWVYIANTSAHNLVVFDANGNHLTTWGSQGNGIDQFSDPIGIAVGPQGNIYVADTGNRRIKILSPEGKTLMVIPVEEWQASAFQEAYLAVDSQANIYVTVPLTSRIQVYHPQNPTSLRIETPSQSEYHLNFPTGIAVDASGAIYVSDTGNHRVLKYEPLQVTLPVSASQRPVFPDFSPAFFLTLLLIAGIIVGFFFYFRQRHSRRLTQYRYRIRRRLRYLVEDITAWGASFRSRRVLQTFLDAIAALLILYALRLFNVQKPDSGSMFLLFGILLISLRQIPYPYHASLLQADAIPTRRRLWLKILVIGLVALALRLYQLDSIPWGINNDAAWNGMFARRILNGEPFTIFTAEAWGKETFYMYLIALSFKLFGVSKLTLYLPGILAGTLTTIMIYLLVRKLFNDRLGVMSALIYGAMAWNITFARTGYRCILAPLCLALTVYFYLLAVDALERGKKLLYFLLCGVSIGIGLNTYFSFRGVPMLMILLGIYSWITVPYFMRKNALGILVLLIGGAIVFAPLGWYALHHKDIFMGRSDFLFIGHKISQTGSWQPLWENIHVNLLTFYYKAKVGNFFNNEIPILSHWLGFFVALGVGYHLRYCLKRSSFFVLLAFGFGMLPAILSAPDAARSLLAALPLAIFGATGVASIGKGFSMFNLRRVAVVMLVILCSAIILAEADLYFNVLGNDPGAQFGYARKHTLIGYKGLELSKDHQIYISQGHFMDTPKFLCYGLPGDVFGITRGEVLHYVSAEELMRNLRRILQTPMPPDKGLAFIFEQDPKNIPLFEEVRRAYPTGTRTDYTDARYGNAVIFYTYAIPRAALGR